MQYLDLKIVNISNLIGRSWKHRHSIPFLTEASARHKISIVNYNYGGFQDETIPGAARRASIQRAVFPAAAEVADAGSHGRAPSHIQPRIQRPGTWEVRCLRPVPAVSLFHAGGGCRVNQKIISCSLFMGKNNGLWQYARALFFCEEIEFCNICEHHRY